MAVLKKKLKDELKKHKAVPLKKGPCLIRDRLYAEYYGMLQKIN